MLHIGQEIIITTKFPSRNVWGTKAIITKIHIGSQYACVAKLIDKTTCPLYAEEIEVLNKQLLFSFMTEE